MLHFNIHNELMHIVAVKKHVKYMKASSDLYHTIRFRMFKGFAFFDMSNSRLVFFLLTFGYLQAHSQAEDYKITSLDEEFTMEVSREKHEVKIILRFKDASQYSHAMIEKTDELKIEFRQCAYIDMDEVKGGLIEKRDRFPRIHSPSYYRLRTVTKEGIERTYPPVRLPAKTL
jgi:hypothetical protein